MTMSKMLLTSAIAITMAVPAMAAEKKMTKEVTEIVGYNVTEGVQYEGVLTGSFNKIDYNNDGVITAKEMQRRTNLEDSYSIFLNMDRNKDNVVTIEEFSSYNKTKGNTQVRSGLNKELGISEDDAKRAVRGTNIKSRVITTKEYYEPIEPQIVKEEPIN